MSDFQKAVVLPGGQSGTRKMAPNGVRGLQHRGITAHTDARAKACRGVHILRADCQAAARGCTSFLMRAAVASSAIAKSYFACRFIHIWADVPK
jgi:hypothetical protein